MVPQLVLQPSSSLMFHQPSSRQPLDVLGQVLSPSVEPPSSRTCSSFLFSPSSQPLLASDHPSDRVPSLCLSLLPRSVVCSLVPASAGVSQLVLQPSSSLMFHQPSAHQPLDVLGLQVLSPSSLDPPSSRTCSSFLFSPSSQLVIILLIGCLLRACLCCLGLLCSLVPASAGVSQLVLHPSSSLIFHQSSSRQPLHVLGQVLSPSVDPPSSRTCSSFLFSPSSQPLLACDHPSDRVPSLCLSLLPRSVVCSLVPASAGVSQLVLQPSSSLMFHQPSAHQPLDVLGLQVLSPSSVDPPSSRTCSSFLFSPSSQPLLAAIVWLPFGEEGLQLSLAHLLKPVSSVAVFFFQIRFDPLSAMLVGSSSLESSPGPGQYIK